MALNLIIYVFARALQLSFVNFLVLLLLMSNLINLLLMFVLILLILKEWHWFQAFLHFIKLDIFVSQTTLRCLQLGLQLAMHLLRLDLQI